MRTEGRIWDDSISERDKELFSTSGHGKRLGFGKRPIVLVIDVIYNFVGDKPEPIMESVKRWRNSCGEEGWKAVAQTRLLLSAARERRVPIFYSTSQEYRPDGFDSGRWRDKNYRRSEDWEEHSGIGNRIVDEISPQPEDVVVLKSKPSVFFGTQFASLLVNLGADSLLVCGTSTSGCVRATVLDAFSYNYRVSVVEECTFDRAQVSHKINLFDMHQKYADVVPLEECIEYLRAIPSGLFDEQMPGLAAEATV
ncbi:MAG: isochorismatase family protein [Trueperaceae bacterium]